MLKRDPSAKLVYEDVEVIVNQRVYFFNISLPLLAPTTVTRRVYFITVGKSEWELEVDEKQYAALLEAQQRKPILLLCVEENGRRWWMFKDDFYCEDEGYTAEEIRALILDRIGQRDKK